MLHRFALEFDLISAAGSSNCDSRAVLAGLVCLNCNMNVCKEHTQHILHWCVRFLTLHFSLWVHLLYSVFVSILFFLLMLLVSPFLLDYFLWEQESPSNNQPRYVLLLNSTALLLSPFQSLSCVNTWVDYSWGRSRAVGQSLCFCLTKFVHIYASTHRHMCRKIRNDETLIKIYVDWGC